MRDYGQIITKIQDSPWLITEGGLRMILQVVDAHITGQVSLEEIRARTENGRRERGSLPKQEGSVGILPLHGPIFPKANLMTELSGATSVEQWQQEFRSLMQNDRVTSILLDIDSPGGSSSMIKEMADEIRSAREQKPIYAIANTMAASAAYFLASQASELYVSDSGYVGSVGTYVVHTDTSELEAKAGVKNTVIHEGKFKAALIQPLTPENRAHIQSVVADCQDQFEEAVALGRKTTREDVRENYGEGGVVSANRALEAGMVDGVRTFDEVLTALLDGGGTLVAVDSNGNRTGSSLGIRASVETGKEHSEPGTGQGGEPAPYIPPDEDVDKWDKGERLHRPPNIPELEENAMNRDQLLAYASRLGIANAADLEDDALVAVVDKGILETLDVADDLRNATSQAQQQVEFAKQFPQQAEELAKLKAHQQEADATLFAHNLANFNIKEGEKETSFRLSTLAQDVVKSAHIKLSQGNLVHDDLSQLIQAVASGGVEQGERGSSRSAEVVASAPVGDRRQDRATFAAHVKELMENDNLDRGAAIEEAGKRYPELAQAYLQS
jgi:signal peptide peptidase SppA